MRSHRASARSLACALSALAGYVDAVGFLELHGLFVSFMSGNTTRLAVGLAQGDSVAAAGGGLIALFVVGVVLGSLTGRFAGERQAPAVLQLVTTLLALAALCGSFGYRIAAIGGMAMAMGAENAVFTRNGEVSIGLTYMTGTLVKFGQHLAAALAGETSFGWLPYLLLWASLAAGAVLGALAYPYFGLNALWVASIAAALLTLAATISKPGLES